MRARPRNTARKAAISKSTAMVLIGVGLLILAGTTLVLLPRSGAAQPPDEAKDYPPAIPVEVDFPAPELKLKDIADRPASLSDYLGQIVLVNNWAFWCPPCRAELPELQAYYMDHSSEGFVTIGIEAGGEKEDVVYHVELYQLTYPIWMDPDSRSLRIFKNNGLPNSYLIDRQGKVRLAWNGPINREMLEKYVTPIIKE